MRRAAGALSSHMSLLAATETTTLFAILFALVVREFLERGVGLVGGGVDFHWDDSAVRVRTRRVCSWSLERPGVTWFGLVAEVKSRCDCLSDFVYLRSRGFLPFFHRGRFIVSIYDPAMDVVFQTPAVPFDCPLGIRLPTRGQAKSFECCGVRVDV